MKIQYDASLALLYIWFAEPRSRAGRTEVASPGGHMALAENGSVVGIEVLEARDALGKDSPIEFAVAVSA